IGERNSLACWQRVRPSARVPELINFLDSTRSFAKRGKAYRMPLVRGKPRDPPPQIVNLLGTGKVPFLAVCPKIEVLDVLSSKPFRKSPLFVAHQKRSE